MNATDTEKRYLDVLELPPGATMTDIRASYKELREIYARGSIALSALVEEEPEGKRADIIADIEEAFEWLSEHHGEGKSTSAISSGSSQVMSAAKMSAEVAEPAECTGPALKAVREALGIELHEIELKSRISGRHLRNIEAEKFSALPESVFVRGYIEALARHLGLNPKRTADQYMARLKAVRQT